MITKSRLAIILSKLEQFKDPSAETEQYSTEAEIAADALWNAYMIRDIKGKIIADLGCGTGTLGLGALILGAKWMFFLDVDSKAVGIARSNYKKLSYEYDIGNKANFIVGDIGDFNKRVEVVIQNPPFGVQVEHADRVFLKKAFEVAKVVYTFHKIESKGFIENISADKGFKVTHIFQYSFPLKHTMAHHTRRIMRIRVGCWRLEKQK